MPVDKFGRHHLRPDSVILVDDDVKYYLARILIIGMRYTNGYQLFTGAYEYEVTSPTGTIVEVKCHKQLKVSINGELVDTGKLIGTTLSVGDRVSLKPEKEHTPWCGGIEFTVKVPCTDS